MQKKVLCFRILRIVFYGALLLLFALLPYEAVTAGPFRCPSALIGLHCPGCGATRALTLLMHGRFAEAWEMNQVFCALLFPGFLAVALQDVYVTLTGKRQSLLEYALALIGIPLGDA